MSRQEPLILFLSVAGENPNVLKESGAGIPGGCREMSLAKNYYVGTESLIIRHLKINQR